MLERDPYSRGSAQIIPGIKWLFVARGHRAVASCLLFPGLWLSYPFVLAAVGSSPIFLVLPLQLFCSPAHLTPLRGLALRSHLPHLLLSRTFLTSKKLRKCRPCPRHFPQGSPVLSCHPHQPLWPREPKGKPFFLDATLEACSHLAIPISNPGPFRDRDVAQSDPLGSTWGINSIRREMERGQVMKKQLTVAVVQLASGLPSWDGGLLKYIFLTPHSAHKCPLARAVSKGAPGKLQPNMLSRYVLPHRNYEVERAVTPSILAEPTWCGRVI